MVRVAFLGPLGTFSHQATLQLFGEDITLAPRSTILATYGTLSDEIPFALLPAENSTHGYVVDTYDILRLPDVGSRFHITGETTLRIEHCLVAPDGTRLEDVKVVLSHEQALGQCAQFLREHLPNVSRLKCASTAEAARLVLQDEAGAGRAAISCAVVLTQYSGLQMLRQGIQDQGENFTRFLLLSTQQSEEQMPTRALLRIQLPSKACDIVPLLVKLGLSTLKIDRRPALSPQPFHDVYLVEVQLRDGDDVDAALKRVREAGGEAVLLGSWSSSG
ncbi:PDT-domain-containing protein [Exidia glandulosa HHB12029]|uniref:PDT-domain-containing protein n=1 Tax=Exidia glandulosa HHB12029 TaxID=1314781 RepID=A0A166BFN2_EXIGL|nr:PDT-domain-containing protein [Exidia glandulosa HHB12029]